MSLTALLELIIFLALVLLMGYMALSFEPLLAELAP